MIIKVKIMKILKDFYILTLFVFSLFTFKLNFWQFNHKDLISFKRLFYDLWIKNFEIFMIYIYISISYNLKF